MKRRLFHIPSTQDGLNFFLTNEKINIGFNYNPRHQDLMQYKPIAPLKSGDITWLNFLEYLWKDKREPENWHFLLERMMETTYRLNNRFYEKIFEEIRKVHYSDLPSRYYCLYLADEISIGYWFDKARNQNKVVSPTIFELEQISAKTHYADSEWLEVDIVSENEYIEIAHDYWQGKKKESLSSFEILATGELGIKSKFTTLDEL
jgi:hypothetical protein